MHISGPLLVKDGDLLRCLRRQAVPDVSDFLCEAGGMGNGYCSLRPALLRDVLLVSALDALRRAGDGLLIYIRPVRWRSVALEHSHGMGVAATGRVRPM